MLSRLMSLCLLETVLPRGQGGEENWHAAPVIKEDTDRGETPREENIVTREKTAIEIKKREGNESGGEVQNPRKIRAFPH